MTDEACIWDLCTKPIKAFVGKGKTGLHPLKYICSKKLIACVLYIRSKKLGSHIFAP